jgi:hypothetical protein
VKHNDCLEKGDLVKRLEEHRERTAFVREELSGSQSGSTSGGGSGGGTSGNTSGDGGSNTSGGGGSTFSDGFSEGFSNESFVPLMSPLAAAERWAAFVRSNTAHTLNVVNNFDPVPRVLGNADLNDIVREGVRNVRTASGVGAGGSSGGSGGSGSGGSGESFYSRARSTLAAMVGVVSTEYFPIGRFASLLGGGQAAEEAPSPLAPVDASLRSMPTPQLRKLLRTPPASVMISGQPLRDHSLKEYQANFRSAFAHSCHLQSMAADRDGDELD